jgi:hypothetical protein
VTSIIGRWGIAPDLIEPIVGYRAWRYTTNDRGVQLLAFVLAGGLPKNDWDGAWAEWVTASCPSQGPTHLAPEESCTCGFYAMKSPDDVGEFASAIEQQAVMSLQVERSEGVVFGRVQLAGKVIEHATGYRAERARIAELIPTTTDNGITLSVASRLGLPVGPTWDTTALLREMEEEFRQSPTDGPSRLGLLDRWRLRMHRRRFRLITGAGAADEPVVRPPRPLHPSRDPSPPAA